LITVLDSDAALQAIGPEWDALWHASAMTTPFQSPHWLLPWWRQFGTGLPRVAIKREAGCLTGVLPLYVLAGERKALPIGAGTTDYLDGLGDTEGLLEAALDRIANDAVDHCDLIDVPPWSTLPHTAVSHWSTTWTPASACPVLTLPALPVGIRRKLRMSRHRADRVGGWTVETAAPATLPDFLGTLVYLHQARWTAQNEPGTLDDPKVLAFWHDAAPRLLEAGLLRLQRLRIGNDLAAVIAALLAPGRAFFYLSGFDERHSFVSPGTLLLGSMLECAVEEGRTEAHFLRGREGYKYAWGAVDRYNRNGRLVPL